MKINLQRINERFHFVAKNERGHSIEMDSKSDFGGDDAAASPMEVLLMSLAGCSSIDIIAILKKQRQEVTDYRVEVVGDRQPIGDAKPFVNIVLHIYLEGNIAPKKAQQAVDLSIEKYCSVAKMLEKTATISHSIYINNQII